MLVVGTVAVVRFDDFVHEWSEIVERFVGATINTNTRVGPLATREDSLSEGKSILVFSVFAFFPNVACQALGEERVGAAWEVGEVDNIFGAVQV
jgi:hypothetical protein